MSHATVMVVLPESPTSYNHAEDMITDLIAPYDESIQVESYKSYAEKLPKDWKTAKYIPYPYGYIKREHIEIIQDDFAIAQLLTEEYDGDEDGGEKWDVDSEGLYHWATYNPDSKWDWWVVGGRWRGHYVVKPNEAANSFMGEAIFSSPSVEGNKADICRKGAINKQICRTQAATGAKQNWDKAHQEEDAQKRSWTYGISANDTEEAYIQRHVDGAYPPQHYAVLTQDGWFEPGAMGWFGMSNETDTSRQEYEKWYNDFWESLSDDTWIACVDYHI